MEPTSFFFELLAGQGLAELWRWGKRNWSPSEAERVLDRAVDLFQSELPSGAETDLLVERVRARLEAPADRTRTYLAHASSSQAGGQSQESSDPFSDLITSLSDSVFLVSPGAPVPGHVLMEQAGLAPGQLAEILVRATKRALREVAVEQGGLTEQIRQADTALIVGQIARIEHLLQLPEGETERPESHQARAQPIPDTMARVLFAFSGNRCAFAGCYRPVVRSDQSGHNTVAGKVYRIPEQREFGRIETSAETPEFDTTTSTEDLMLLCPECYDIVERDQGIAYPPLKLREMKQVHEQKFRRPTTPNAGASTYTWTLPRRDKQFTGRESCVTQILGILTPETEEQGGIRCIVVTGQPGVGKTSIALEAARQLDDLGTFSSIFIPSSSGVNDSSTDLLEELLAILDPGLSSPTPSRTNMRAQLASLLRNQPYLVVLDDIRTEGPLREVLEIDAPLDVICTSRRRLSGLADCEINWIDLGPLSRGSGATLAKAVAPRLTEDQAEMLCDLCDGLPLAIRIAASHLASRPSIDVAKYLRQLESPNEYLASIAAGERTLTSILDSSYRSLTATQQKVLEVLAVLPNVALSVDVVAAACKQDFSETAEVDSMNVLRELDTLYEVNLVEQLADRVYRLHQSIYKYLNGKQESSRFDPSITVGEACVMQAVLIRDCLEGMDAEDKIQEGEAGSSVELYRHSSMALVEHALGLGVWEPTTLLARELGILLHLRGYWSDVVRLHQCMKTGAEENSDDDWLATSLHNLGIASARRGRTADAIEYLAESEKMAVDTQNIVMACVAAGSYASVMQNSGRPDEAYRVLRHLFKPLRAMGEDRILANFLTAAASACRALGLRKRARRYAQNASRLSSKVNAGPSKSADLLAQISLLDELTDSYSWEAAAPLARSILSRVREVGDRPHQARVLHKLWVIEHNLNPSQTDDELLYEALDIYRTLGDELGERSILVTLAINGNHDIGRRIDLLVQCLALATSADDPGTAAICLEYLAEAHRNVGHIDEARQMFSEAREMAEHATDGTVKSEVYRRQGVELLRQRDVREALPLLERAVQLLRDGTPALLASARLSLAETYVMSGQMDEAAGELQHTKAIDEDLLPTTLLAEVKRVSAVLCSYKGLEREALSSAKRAVELSEEAGDIATQMHCRHTFANMLASTDEWGGSA